ncbi:hypothetical protein [Chamaesiphon sp. OTE_75_metabat_556]|uniref:hypothetical protein n=1 Tax=Chamaesiphon sp. OTE_75_metabat_556 TaxID=2964692 RepID=UPI00286D51DF|nr:hypothetical protein [Chamaesiphon sp. OTE_75_metabat_556]
MNSIEKLPRFLASCAPSIAGSIAIFSWMFVSSAYASTYICPSGPRAGERQVGMTGGGNGIGSLPICAATATGAAKGESPQVDGKQRAINALTGFRRYMAENQREVDRLVNDPRFKTYHKGGWEFYQTKKKGAGPGEYCAAVYWSKHGMVVFSGPGGTFKNAMLIFLGDDVPKPSQATNVKVTLLQSDGAAPQTVSAYNYVEPGEPFGSIALVVPSIEAGLEGMSEKQSFKLMIKDKVIYDLSWHSGLMAREHLKKCASQK